MEGLHMEISGEELERIERLAMISVSGGSRAALRDQISRIIGFVAQLRDIDTSEYEEGEDEGQAPPALREDDPGDCLAADAALSQAPEKARGMFRVPAVVAGDGSEE